MAVTPLMTAPIRAARQDYIEKHGAAALSTPELLRVLGADSVAEGNLRDLAGESVTALCNLHGLTPKAAARVAAAIELGTRATQAAQPALTFHTPNDAQRYLIPRYGLRPLETFGLLALNVRHRLVREVVISTGCLTSSTVHPREVFREAIAARAVALVLFHNHPSGDPEPSAEDIALTRRLASAGTLMGIEVLDHVIVGAGRSVSLKERGAL